MYGDAPRIPEVSEARSIIRRQYRLRGLPA